MLGAYQSVENVDIVLEYVDGGELFDAIIARKVRYRK